MLKRILFLLGLLILAGCAPVEVQPTTTPTPTQYTPVSAGTAIPPLYEAIDTHNASELSLIANWEGSGGTNNRLAFSNNGEYLLSGKNSKIYRAWDAMNGNIESTRDLEDVDIRLFDPVRSYFRDDEYIAWISDGDLLISKPAVTKGDLFFYFDDAIGVSFVPNTESFAVAINDGTILFAPIDVFDEKFIGLEDDETNYSSSFPASLEFKVEHPFRIMAFSTDGSQMVLFYPNGTVQVWELASLELVSQFRNPDLVINPVNLVSFAFSPDNKILAIGDTKGIIRIWETRTGNLVHEFQSPQEQIDSLAFSPNGQLLASLDDKSGVTIWGILPTIELEAAVGTSTAIAKLEPTSTAIPSGLPEPTITPASPLPTATTEYPVGWPIQAFTPDQVAEAINCNIEDLVEERYPEDLEYWELATAHELESACDWASLAYAYRIFFEDDEIVSDEAILAYTQTISLNPAFSLKLSLFYSFFNSVDTIVLAPPLLSQEITAISITYDWGGIGEPSHVEYQINIHNAHLPSDEMSISVTGEPAEHLELLNKNIDTSVTQSFGSALGNLVPIEEQFSMPVCTDNYSDWLIELTFLDGTELTLVTNSSNFLFAGGPWFTEIDGQNYVQYSPDFLIEVLDLMEALELPIGQPYAWTCFPEDPLSLAFPSP